MLCGSVACPRLALTRGRGGAVHPTADAEATAEAGACLAPVADSGTSP